jgi:uncharacterized GH25 family protein
MELWSNGIPLGIDEENQRLDIWLGGIPHQQLGKNAYTISGRVTLSDGPIQGAIVTCIPDNGNTTMGQQITDSNGYYSFIVSKDQTYHCAVEYYDAVEDKKYNAMSAWGVIPLSI